MVRQKKNQLNLFNFYDYILIFKEGKRKNTITMENRVKKITIDGIGAPNNNNNQYNHSNNNNHNQQFRNNLLSGIEVTFSEIPCEHYDEEGDKYDKYEKRLATENMIISQEMATLSVDGITNQANRLKRKSSTDKEADSCSILSTSTTATSPKSRTLKKSTIDGGYGWVVVFASFVISMIVDGISFSFGLLVT